VETIELSFEKRSGPPGEAGRWEVRPTRRKTGGRGVDVVGSRGDGGAVAAAFVTRLRPALGEGCGRGRRREEVGSARLAVATPVPPVPNASGFRGDCSQAAHEARVAFSCKT